MALTVEDGSLVAGADSYVTVAEVRTYASSRGVSGLPAADADVEALVINAMDLVESYRDQFKGTKVSTTQTLQWPRDDVYIDGVLFATDAIPTELKNAVCQFAVDGNTVTLQPNLGGRTITKEKVDVIEVEYAARGASADYTVFSKALTFMGPLLINSFALRTIRI